MGWLEYAIIIYGNVLYQANITKTILGNSSLGACLFACLFVFFLLFIVTFICVESTALCGIMLDVLSFLGAALAVSTLTTYTSRSMQLQGFIMVMVLLLAVVSVLVLNPNLKIIAVTIYAFVYFFCGFGPASTTFLMPSLLSPVETRGTFNGVAAAAGRIGTRLHMHV